MSKNLKSFCVVTLLAVTCASLSACMGGVQDFIAATKADYRAAETRGERIAVLAGASCQVRASYPDEMKYFRSKIRAYFLEEGYPQVILTKAREKADKECGAHVDQ